MPENRPTWQIHECPPWCEGGHREFDHADDRIHRTVAHGTPVATLDGAVVDLEIAVWRRDGDARTWLYLGAGAGREVQIALSDAPRVVQAVLRVLDVDDSRTESALLRALAAYLVPPVRRDEAPAERAG